VLHLLKNPSESGVVNMLAIPLADRPAYFAGLLPRLQELRSQTGRPHWLVVDEAHHMLPSSWEAAPRTLPRQLGPVLLVTLHPSHVSREALAGVDIVLAVGEEPEATLQEFAETLDIAPPRLPDETPREMELVAWFRDRTETAELIQVTPARGDRRRHRRKYAEGDVGAEKSFMFRGPESRLKLRAQNLVIFMQMADGVDDETWFHHLRQHDYSRWFRQAIKDDGLAQEVERIERLDGLSADESRDRVRAAIEDRYSNPA
jgi:hypothetical protein